MNTVLCAERKQPIPTGDNIYYVTVGDVEPGHFVSATVMDGRVPPTKRRKHLPKGQVGLRVYNTTIASGAEIPEQGEFAFCVDKIIAVYFPRLQELN